MISPDVIRNAWSNYPEVKLTIKEIRFRTDLPKWEDCNKNAFYVGIIRRKSGDRIITVSHRLESICNITTRFEDLDVEDLKYLGILPTRNMYCGKCQEFATRINVDGLCCDCSNNNKGVVA